MPPRKDTSVPDETIPNTTDQLLHQLISVTTDASKNNEAMLADLVKKIDILSNHVAAESSGVKSPHVHRSPPQQRSPNSHHHPRQPKITLPFFDGSNVLDWIFQADNFFSYYQTPVDERVELAVFYLIGDALSWYKHLANNELLGTWPAFKHEIELRFGPSTYENHEATLFKLRQTSTVAVYQTEFEKVINRVVGLSPQALRNCFISGLRADIQNELAILKPTTLHQAYALTRLIEEKLSISTAHPFSSPPVVNSTHVSSKPVAPALLPAPTVTTSAATTTDVATPKLPIARLTPEQLQQRRAAGLCFNCPEKYAPGHRCDPPQFILIVDNDDSTTKSTIHWLEDNPSLPRFLSISPSLFFSGCLPPPPCASPDYTQPPN